MAAAKTTDAQFREICAQNGHSPVAIARETGTGIRSVQRRMDRLGLRKSSEYESTLAKYGGHIENLRYNGPILVFTDAHFWPEKYTPASDSFKILLKIAKHLKPGLIVDGGDSFDGYSLSRFPKHGWHEGPSVIEELTAVKAAKEAIVKASPKSDLRWVWGNHDCFDTHTECLTARGWMPYTGVLPEDKILSLVDGVPVWSGIDEIVEFDYTGDMVSIEKTRMSMLVTPNHRVLLNTRNWRTGEFDTPGYALANNLPFAFTVPMAGVCALSDFEGVSDDEIELAGWILTDVSYSGGQVSIYQSKPVGRAKIEDVLQRLGIEYSVYERDREISAICRTPLKKQPLTQAKYYIHAEAARRVQAFLPSSDDMPTWARSLSPRQFDIFLNAIIDGDGVWDGNVAERGCCVIYGREKFLSNMQALAVSYGWRARLATDTRGQYRLCLSKIRSLRLLKSDTRLVAYSGKVWCLRVPHGNFMVRRKGSAYFSGNSRFDSRLANQADQFKDVEGFKLPDHFPNWRFSQALKINDTIKFVHHWRGGEHAAYNDAMRSGISYCSGHDHQLYVRAFVDERGTRFGIKAGTLADPRGPQFFYTNGNMGNNWAPGMVIIHIDGNSIHPEPVYVINGTARWGGKIWSAGGQS